jgi:hypothetical protein
MGLLVMGLLVMGLLEMGLLEMEPRDLELKLDLMGMQIEATLERYLHPVGVFQS